MVQKGDMGSTPVSPRDYESGVASFVALRLGASADAVPADARRGRWWRDALRRRYLLVADIAAISLALLIASGVEQGLWAIVFLPVAVLISKIANLYDRDHRELRHLSVDEIPALFVWSVISVLAVDLLAGSIATADPARSEVAVAVGLTFVLALAFRVVARSLWRLRTSSEQVLIVGQGDLAAAFRRKLELFEDLHMAEHTEDSDRIDRVVIASERLDASELAEIVEICRTHEAKLSVVSPLRGQASPVEFSRLAELPMLGYGTADVSRSTLLLKRAMDLAIGIPLAVFSVLIAIPIAIAIRLEGPGPILFRQERVGLDRRRFTMWKFRTMRVGAADQLADLIAVEELEDPMFKLRSDPRVTKVGRILRRFSLDEVPQVWNVLKGEMSLVGPRPEEVGIVERYRPEHLFRLSVKPGLTGPMQVFGRGELTFAERLSVELDYVENLSLGRDLRIISLTPLSVIRGRGAF